jgi:phospholipid/cholesterol/gamma-HCH transport system substrate-binding protein
MENKSHALAAGIFVLVASALLAALAVWLTRDQGEYHLYEISTSEIVSGLQPQAPVRYRGVDVGKVVSIGFDPQKRGNVLVRLQVDEAAPMTQATFAQLNFQGVTGLAFVQLDDGGKAAEPLPPNDDQPPRIPLKPSLFGKLAERGEVIIDQVEKITTQMNKLLADDNQKRMATALEGAAQATQNVAALTARMQVVLDAQLGPDRVNVPALVKETTATMKEASATMKSLQATSDKAGQAVQEVTKTAQRLNEKDGPIDRLAEGSEALSAAADAFNAATLPRINQVTDETSRAVRRLSRAANSINDNPQSLIFGNGAANPGPGEPGFAAPQGGTR